MKYDFLQKGFIISRLFIQYMCKCVYVCVYWVFRFYLVRFVRVVVRIESTRVDLQHVLGTRSSPNRLGSRWLWSTWRPCWEATPTRFVSIRCACHRFVWAIECNSMQLEQVSRFRYELVKKLPVDVGCTTRSPCCCRLSSHCTLVRSSVHF